MPCAEAVGMNPVGISTRTHRASRTATAKSDLPASESRIRAFMPARYITSSGLSRAAIAGRVNGFASVRGYGRTIAMTNQFTPIAAAAPEDDARQRGERASISLICEVRQSFRDWRKVRLKDISRTGFRIAWYPNVDMRQPLRIRIPGLELLTAHIRWKAEHSLGCEFATPLHVAVLDHIVRSAIAQGSADQ